MPNYTVASRLAVLFASGALAAPAVARAERVVWAGPPTAGAPVVQLMVSPAGTLALQQADRMIDTTVRPGRFDAAACPLDGTLAVADAAGDLALIAADGAHRAARAESRVFGRPAAMLGNGVCRFAAATIAGDLVVVDGERVTVHPAVIDAPVDPAEYPRGIDVTAVGTSIVAVTAGRSLSFVQTETGAVDRRSLNAVTAGAPAADPAGGLWYLTRLGDLVRAQPFGATVTAARSSPAQRGFVVLNARRARGLVWAGDDGRVWLYDGRLSNPAVLPDAPDAEPLAVDYLNTGDRQVLFAGADGRLSVVAFGADETVEMRVQLGARAAAGWRVVQTSPDAPAHLVLGADGTRIAFPEIAGRSLYVGGTAPAPGEQFFGAAYAARFDGAPDDVRDVSAPPRTLQFAAGRDGCSGGAGGAWAAAVGAYVLIALGRRTGGRAAARPCPSPTAWLASP